MRRIRPPSTVWIAALCCALSAWATEETAGSAAADAELIPLELKLPPPYFGGTPLRYDSENFEAKEQLTRPAFKAPRGAMNLSAGRPVTSSDPDPNYGKLSFITDGVKGYQQEYVTELAPGVQWVQIDLGETSEIYAIVIWHFYGAERVYFDVVAQVADDADFKTGVRTVYNNDIDNSFGLGVGNDKEYIDDHEGRLIDAKGVRGRYVRCYSNGNTSDRTNHYIEIEVWGKPVTSK